MAKVKPAALMIARRLPFLVNVYPFKPSCLTSSSMRAGACASPANWARALATAASAFWRSPNTT